MKNKLEQFAKISKNCTFLKNWKTLVHFFTFCQKAFCDLYIPIVCFKLKEESCLQYLCKFYERVK